MLGHELGHVVRQHSKAEARMKILASLGARAAFQSITGDVGEADLKLNLFEVLAGYIAELLVNARYSRFQEQQADDFAFVFMMTHGYRPEALVSLFGKLGQESKVSKYDSHPPSAARASRMRELIAKTKEE